jgi:hypothetical protein
VKLSTYLYIVTPSVAKKNNVYWAITQQRPS